MTLLVVDHELVYRRFGEHEPLGSRWGEIGVKLPTDDAVAVVAEGSEEQPRNLVEFPALPKVTEGLGFVVVNELSQAS